MTRRAERVYRRLVSWLLPSSVGSEYGEDAVEMFRDRMTAAGSAFGRIAAFIRAVADLAVQSVAIRMEPPSSQRRSRVALPDNLWPDARRAFRQWLRTPSDSIAVLATLGGGIGITTAMFTVLNGVVLQPLSFARPDRLVMVWERNLQQGWPRFTVSPANFFDWSGRASVFESMSAYTTGTATMTGEGEPVRLQEASARWNLFSVAGIEVIIGRAFTAEENEVSNDDVVLLSHRLWTGRFGSDSTILERSIQLDGRPHRIVGVLPGDFELSVASDIWVPLTFPFDIEGARGARYLTVVARLGEGSSVASAQARMDGLATALESEHPETNNGWSAVVVPMREQLLRGTDGTLILLFAAVALVLLIACANVINLLLARGTSRAGEFSVCKAMGAAPGRLARQVLMESLVISVAGAAVGLLVARAVTGAIVGLNAGRLPRAANIHIDLRVLLFCCLLAIVVAAVVALVPALQASRASVSAGLLGQGRSRTSGRTVRHLRNAILAAEIAMAVVLLTGFGLVARSLWTLVTIDPGFRPAGLVMARLSPPAVRYPTPADRSAFYDAVTERLRANPQIENVTVANRLPLMGSMTFGITADREPVPPAGEWSGAELRSVDPEYFVTMGIRVMRGRSFDNGDVASAPSVAIINEMLAARLFPGEDPIGRRIRVASLDAACPCEVVGVAGNVREAAIDQPATAVYYLPQSQSVWTTRAIVVRSNAPLASVVSALRESVSAFDTEIALFDVQPVDRVVDANLAAPRFNAVLFATFAALALLLAMIGIYSVTSYVVNRRRREIGVRSALGARTGGIVWLVEREALAVTAAGIVIGIAAAFATTRYLRSMLFGVEPMDPLIVIGVVTLLALVSAAAAFGPAWRAGRVAPVEALRTD